MNPSDDYKLTDLDYLIGDHHLQMMKAALPYLNVPEQRMMSMLIKVQELKRTFELFQDEEVATMGICSIDHDASSTRPGKIKEILGAIRPYGNPAEQEFIDLAKNLLDGQRPMEQIKKFLNPRQQARMENIEMMIQAMQFL